LTLRLQRSRGGENRKQPFCELYSAFRIRQVQHTSVHTSVHASAYVSMRQHTSAYVSIHTCTGYSGSNKTVCLSACVRHTSAYVSIRKHTSAYVSIRQHTYLHWVFGVQQDCVLVLDEHNTNGHFKWCERLATRRSSISRPSRAVVVT
jgi:hypothetical protein